MVEWKKLGEVCEIYDGTHQTPKYRDHGVKFVSVENIQEPYNSNKYISEEDYNTNYKTKPHKGDVLMTRIGDVGTCSVLSREEPIAYYVSLALLRPNNQFVQSNYVKYVLESDIGKRELRKRTLLTAVPLKINLGDVGKIILPIPSLSEQTRIVGILDTFTAAIDNLKQQIAQRRKQYEHYRDQLLDLEGKEGVEMRALGDLCEFSQGIQVPVSEQFQEKNDGYTRFLRIIDFTQGCEPPRYVAITDKRYWVSKHDIAIVRYGSPGFVCTGLEGIIANNLFKVNIKNQAVNQDYLCIVLKSNIFQSIIRCKSSGGALQAISFGMIRDIIIPVPSLPEQQRIVSILDTFESSIANLEQQLAQRERQYEYYRNKLLTFE